MCLMMVFDYGAKIYVLFVIGGDGRRRRTLGSRMRILYRVSMLLKRLKRGIFFVLLMLISENVVGMVLIYLYFGFFGVF